MVCPGVHEIEMELLRFTWSRRTFIREMMCLLATGLMALVANKAVCDDVVTRGDCRIQGLAPLLDPVEGVEYGTEFPGIARGSPGSKSIRARKGDVDTGPHIARVSARPGKVMWTPQPADPVGRAESSVKRKAVGSSNRGSPGPVDIAMYSSAFFPVENLFKSAGVPTVWG